MSLHYISNLCTWVISCVLLKVNITKRVSLRVYNIQHIHNKGKTTNLFSYCYYLPNTFPNIPSPFLTQPTATNPYILMHPLPTEAFTPWTSSVGFAWGTTFLLWKPVSRLYFCLFITCNTNVLLWAPRLCAGISLYIWEKKQNNSIMFSAQFSLRSHIPQTRTRVKW